MELLIFFQPLIWPITETNQATLMVWKYHVRHLNFLTPTPMDHWAKKNSWKLSENFKNIQHYPSKLIGKNWQLPFIDNQWTASQDHLDIHLILLSKLIKQELFQKSSSNCLRSVAKLEWFLGFQVDLIHIIWSSMLNNVKEDWRLKMWNRLWQWTMNS